MKIVLERSIRSSAFEVNMELGTSSVRDELLSILQLDGDQLITPRRVNIELLGKNPNSSIGIRILEMMERQYDLLDKLTENGIDSTYKLTSSGRYTLENNGMVFEPKSDSYIIHLTEDPLIKEKIIGFDNQPRVNSNWRKRSGLLFESKKIKEDRDKGQDDLEDLPDWLLKEKGAIKFLPLQEGISIKIFKIKDKAIRIQNSRRIDIQLILENGNSQIVKAKSNGMKHYSIIDTDFNEDFEEVLIDLLLTEIEEFKLYAGNGSYRVLIPMRFLNRKELISLKKDFKIRKSSIKGYGDFESLLISDVPILPIDEYEAVEWANLILINSIVTYIDEDGLEELKKKIAEKFKPKYDVYKMMHRHEEVIRSLRSIDRRSESLEPSYWYLNAPKDLTMEDFN